MTMLLEIAGLESGYDGGKVLDGVAMSVPSAQIVTLVGRNGVGKTTLMRTLMGLLPVTRGHIRMNGKEVGAEPIYARAKRGMGYVPQGREVFAALTVGENLMAGSLGAAGRVDLEMMNTVMNYFPVLRAKQQQKAGTMSGGEQQQLAIARALIGRPHVLLLDEPSEGIQPSIVTLIGQTLAKIAAETGIGVLLVEQDLGMVERIADSCYVMDKGRIVSQFAKEQLSDLELIRQHLAL